MQKFTRPLTREIELAGARLALTLSDKGVSVRPVGSRKPPRDMSWEALIGHVMSQGTTAAPVPEEETAAPDPLNKDAFPPAAAQVMPAAEQSSRSPT